MATPTRTRLGVDLITRFGIESRVADVLSHSSVSNGVSALDLSDVITAVFQQIETEHQLDIVEAGFEDGLPGVLRRLVRTRICHAFRDIMKK
jgi:hypothetical protein